LNGPLAMTGGTITGSKALMLGGDVTATSSAAGPATISAPVALDGPRTFTVTQGEQTPDLALSNVVSDGTPVPGSLSKAGTGTLALSGPTSNAYTGVTTVQAGTVTLHQATGLSIPGAVTIGTGAGAPGSAALRELQSSDLPTTANVTINSDGVFDLNGHADLITGLTVNGGSVLLGAVGSQISIPPTGGVTMTGGTIAGPGGNLLLQNGGLTASSSAQGPATISAPTVLGGTGAADFNPTFTVNPGTAPELVLSGAVSEANGMHGLIKAGAGTLQSTGADTYSGTTAITAGTFVANGQAPGPVNVAPQTTLTGHGVLGPVTVAGTLTPQVGLRTGPLSFSAGGSFNFAIPSTDPSTTPTVTSTGPVAIDPAAVLTFSAASGLTVPGGAIFPAITDTGNGTITGTFAGGPFTTPDGVPVTANDAGGDGNDLVLTAANVAPVAGSISATPASARTGQMVTFSVSPSDANRDKLTTTWNFGDGTTGTGASASHAYPNAGTYKVVATISDGAAQVQASTQVAITAGSAFTSLSVKPKQTGTKITGSLKVATAGSTLKITLQIRRRAPRRRSPRRRNRSRSGRPRSRS
jgi:fibronectin-binding autotransporter adhesin